MARCKSGHESFITDGLQVRTRNRSPGKEMRFIVVDSRTGRARSIGANGLVLGLAFASLVALPATTGLLGYQLGVDDAEMNQEVIHSWRNTLSDQSDQIDDLQQSAQDNLDAASLQLARLQARVVRMEALGQRLTELGDLEEGEFDFLNPPALGGPPGPEELSETDIAYQPPYYMDELSLLADRIIDRELQLGVLERLLVDREMLDKTFVAGRPVVRGYQSSDYGWRTDPISGRRAWHNGVDFAGKKGSDVVSVAAGVVLYAAPRFGYGNMVEVYHGGGYSTRYGHHEKILVKPGDIVKRGAVIGTMGSSGRSTGPHVHFEVFKNGRVVDPSSYIRRVSR